jgi:homoserine O-succinyltransferase
MLSNSPLQVEVELPPTSTHYSKNTPADHLLKFYKTFSEVKNSKSTVLSSPRSGRDHAL